MQSTPDAVPEPAAGGFGCIGRSWERSKGYEHSVLKYHGGYVVSYDQCVLRSIAGGGRMALLSDPPPPPLAANVGLSDLTVQVASENLCAAAAQILTLTRTLRLSLLLMDTDTVEAEEQVQVEASMEKTKEALEKAVELEQEYLKRIQGSLSNGTTN